MNIQEALDQTDQMKPNMMNRALKIRYLQELDQMIWREILLKHVHRPSQREMPRYTEDTDPGKELLAPDPYSKVYKYWLMAKIDEQNLEMDKYNNDSALFNTAYMELHDWWNRTFMPIQRHRQIHI